MVLSHVVRELEGPALWRFYERLAQSLQVVRFDGRATGMSGPGQLSLDGTTADISAVARAVGCTSPALLGISSRIGHAIPFATRHPERVSCLVALHPALNSGPTKIGAEAITAMQRGFSDGPRMLAASLDPLETEPLARLIADVWKAGEPSAADRSVLAEDLPARAEQVRAPLLCVDWPERDTSQGRELATHVPNARLLSRAGGTMPWLDPDQDGLIASIREFILAHATEAPSPQTASPPPPDLVPPDGVRLSPRELEVLRLIAAGNSNPQIAEQLVIAPATVGRHVSNLLAKTGLSNRTELTRYAIEQGLA